MKLLLTGASGFVGSNFIAKWHQKYQITAIVRPNSQTQDIKNSCNIFVYDEEIESLIALFEKEHFDGIIHLATLYKSTHTPKELNDFFASNLLFGTQILEAMRVSPPKFFINTLTSFQFAHPMNPSYYPLNLYAAHKQAFLDIIAFYAQSPSTHFANLLIYNTYGCLDPRPKVFNLWAKNLLDQTELKMSSGRQKIDISHIDDVVDGFDVLIENILAQRDFDSSVIYTLENFPRYSLKELASIFEKALSAKLCIAWGALAERENEILDPISSLQSSLFLKLPHWQPKISLEVGIKQTFGGRQ
ncbi:hypothetical protein BKH46_04760 [Helicobacter sp. 12S02634-8]|uniref:NAD-dependent epimerase/dehydratase family protein n=1 Tax=Helicobacter sp. 12S02634-8 TaxID=1476199 RepID=UPI000BA7D571|nr:NAD(P)-dependent oxidoreductase [Helicobacter sp. 12S02634-8]PAF47035.1 hypothetical protein BKH46_04760 [Helicobacter sp. 12S02634-8]